MSPQKAISVRIPAPMEEQINALARIEGVPVSELVREAIEDYMYRRRSEEDLKERLKKRMEEDWKILEHLGKRD
jgi:Arc/MetJ-type ribon-helix-helix transcriptional regulator